MRSWTRFKTDKSYIWDVQTRFPKAAPFWPLSYKCGKCPQISNSNNLRCQTVRSHHLDQMLPWAGISRPRACRDCDRHRGVWKHGGGAGGSHCVHLTLLCPPATSGHRAPLRPFNATTPSGNIQSSCQPLPLAR
jgi:hypothetical protein